MADYVAVSNAQAWTVPCPKCGVAAGARCVRVRVVSYGGFVDWPSLYRDNPVGRELSAAHVERRDAFREARTG